jgi:hypothetical protein
VEPGYGPLFHAALGNAPLLFTGGTVGAMPDPARITFAQPHALTAGQAICCGGEMRFVTSVVDTNTVVLNAPLTEVVSPGAPVGPTVTYLLATKLPSLSIFDYWAPAEAVHRVITGGGMDRGDFHQFSFSGVASDIVDSASFTEGQAGLSTFPEEPAVADWSYSLVPGNLGQAWFGATPQQFFTVLEAEVLLDNDIELRSREFGSLLPRCMVPGRRSVTADFRIYANTQSETLELYQAARQRSPLSMMLQLGQQSGHLCGVYLQAFVPEVPEFEDDERRLQWRFRSCAAQGIGDDELIVAFG